MRIEVFLLEKKLVTLCWLGMSKAANEEKERHFGQTKQLQRQREGRKEG